MKTISVTTHYLFFKPTGNGSHHFVRITNDAFDRFDWAIGREYKEGLVSCVGFVTDETKSELEAEYQAYLITHPDGHIVA